MRTLSERGLRGLLGGVGIGCFLLLLSMDYMTENDEITFIDWLVDAVTLFLTIGASVGIALLVQRMHVQHEQHLALIQDLEIARAEGQGWRSKVQAHLAGLKGAMDKQFEVWGMTAAERDVGLLILKGLSHKEIAALRATTDATVRQQAQAIYRKAGLPGKTAFSAYFLEDLVAAEPDSEPRLDGAVSVPRAGNGHGGHVLHAAGVNGPRQ